MNDYKKIFLTFIYFYNSLNYDYLIFLNFTYFIIHIRFLGNIKLNLLIYFNKIIFNFVIYLV